FFVFAGPMKRAAQIRHETGLNDLEDVERGRAWLMFQVSVCATTELLDLHIGVDDHRGRRVGTEHDPVGCLQKLTARGQVEGGCRNTRNNVASSVVAERELRSRNILLRVDLVLSVHHLKKIFEGADRFSRAEN